VQSGSVRLTLALPRDPRERFSSKGLHQ